MISIIASFFAGILSSIVVWWITNRTLHPRIEVTDRIAKTPNGKFLIGIRNASHYRDIYDITVYVRYRFASDNYYSTKMEQIAMLKRSPGKSEYTKSEMIPFATKLFLDGYKNAKGELLTAEDFFNDRDNKDKGFIDVFVIGYDVVSGSTRHVISQRYFSKDLVINAQIRIDNNTMKVEPIRPDSGIQSHFYDHYHQADI